MFHVSTPLPYYNLLTLWNYGGHCPPSLFKKVYNMEKIKDNIEIIFLISIFISSLSAITPIT